MAVVGMVLYLGAIVCGIFAFSFSRYADNWAETNKTTPEHYKKISKRMFVLAVIVYIISVLVFYSSLSEDGDNSKYKLLGLASVLGSSATIIFKICLLFSVGIKKYKTSIIFLILMIISIVTAVYFNTEETEMFGRVIFYVGGTIMTLAGIFLLFGEGTRKVGLIAIVISIIFVFGVSEYFGMKFVSTPKYNYSDNKDNGGFVGSDGKYHEYIPEFGDDVNNWMEENW